MFEILKYMYYNPAVASLQIRFADPARGKEEIAKMLSEIVKRSGSTVMRDNYIKLVNMKVGRSVDMYVMRDATGKLVIHVYLDKENATFIVLPDVLEELFG